MLTIVSTIIDTTFPKRLHGNHNSFQFFHDAAILRDEISKTMELFYASKYLRLLFHLETRGGVTALESNHAVIIFEIEAFEAERRFVCIVESSNVRIRHKMTVCVIVWGI